MSGEASPPDSKDATGLHNSTRDPEELRSALEAWLRRACIAEKVLLLEIPEHTGVSSISAMLTVSAAGNDALGLVARLAPDAGAVPVFPTYDLEKQFLVLDHISRHSSVPVPKVLRLETDPEPLGVPFFLMERIDGQIPPDILPYPFGSWVTEAALPDQRRMQDSAVRALAVVHAVSLTEGLSARLDAPHPGDSPLRRHVADLRAYYAWCSADGVRSSVLEASFSWLDEHWPEGIEDAGLSWGDSRIGNMIFRDYAAVALLDWEMVGLGPPEMDLGWMIYLHRWFDDLADQLGIRPMRHFMRASDVVEVYEDATGHEVRSLKWFLFYAALRHGVVMFRVSRRPILFGQAEMPDDPNDLVMHRRSLEEMMSGSYWAGFEAGLEG